VLWLLPVILLSFGFGQLFKWSQRQGHSAAVVVSANYLVLAAVLALYFLASGQWPSSPAAALVGTITGLSFIVSMLVMTHALIHIDAAATLTSFRLSVIVPIVVGVWIWGETATLTQAFGIGLALVSLVLFTWPRHSHSGRRSLVLVAMVFALQGLSQCCLRWVHYADLDSQRLYVLMFTALTAGIVGAIFVIARRLPLRRADILAGASIGLFNLIALAVILTALAQIQGTVFFPLSGCGVVVLDNLFAHYIWKEPLGRIGLAGAVLGAFSMLLVV
jgi:drug/metabolite transporter (DMT)-like permease